MDVVYWYSLHTLKYVCNNDWLCLPLVHEDEHLLTIQPEWYHDVPVFYPVDVPVTGYPPEGEIVSFLLRQCSSCQRMAVEDWKAFFILCCSLLGQTIGFDMKTMLLKPKACKWKCNGRNFLFLRMTYFTSFLYEHTFFFTFSGTTLL